MAWTTGFRLRRQFETPSVFLGDWACNGTSTPSASEETSPSFQIWLQRTGAHRVEADDYRAVAAPGTALLRSPGEVVRICSPAVLKQRGTLLLIDERSLHDIREDGGGARSRIRTLSARAVLLHAELHAALRNPHTAELEIQERVLDVARAVLDEPSAVRACTSLKPQQLELVYAAQELVALRYPQRLLLDDIARTVGTSPFHLTRLFTRQMGMPLHRWLKRVRLAAATDAINAGAADLSRLALDVGFSSHSHLTTAFRAEFGCTPSQLRSWLHERRARI